MDAIFSLLLKRFDFAFSVRLNSTGSKDLNASPCIWGKEMWKMSKEEGSKKGRKAIHYPSMNKLPLWATETHPAGVFWEMGRTCLWTALSGG